MCVRNILMLDSRLVSKYEQAALSLIHRMSFLVILDVFVHFYACVPSDVPTKRRRLILIERRTTLIR